MQNDRPLDDPRTQEALDKIRAIFDEYDLCGGAYVVNDKEMGFTYQTVASWNAVYDDPHAPLGFRIRAKSDETGEEETHRLLEGAVWTFAAMRDFGVQSEKWGGGLLSHLADAGIVFDAHPFGGESIGTIGAFPAPPGAAPPDPEPPVSRAERRRRQFGRN